MSTLTGDAVQPTSNTDPSLGELGSGSTVALAVQDVRRVLQEQREQRQILTTQLNILFVTNGGLLTILTISRLLSVLSLFSLFEILGFFVNFTLLIAAFLPRQVVVSPNLQDGDFLERYLALSADEYQIQMLVNLVETYNVNKQRLDDISQSLSYAAYVTWGVVFVVLLHMIAAYFLPDLQPIGSGMISYSVVQCHRG